MGRQDRVLAALAAALAGIAGVTVGRAAALPETVGRKDHARVYNGDEEQEEGQWLSRPGQPATFVLHAAVEGMVSAPEADASAFLAARLYQVRKAILTSQGVWDAIGSTGALRFASLETDFKPDAQALGRFVQVVSVRYTEQWKD